MSRARPEPWRAVHRAADRAAPRFAVEFVRSVQALRRKLTLATLEQSVISGTLSREVADAIDAIKVAKIAADPSDLATKVYAETIVDTVQGQAAYVEGLWGTQGATIVGRFNVVSPFVLRAAETLTADLIREVGAETKQAVRRIIFNAVRDGVPPREAAEQIRDILGLTTRQALAVNRLEAGLLEQGAEARFARAAGRRYSDRLLRDRAENIARTETMRAANRGQQLLWTEMRNDGVIPDDFGQRWLTTPDDRLCSRCAPMNGKVVQLGYLFRETERGVLPSKRTPVAGSAVSSPPLHPRCRCTLVFNDDIDSLPEPGRPPVPQPAPPTPKPAPADRLTTEQREALTPAKRYNAKLRRQTEESLRTTENGGHLADAINDFQHEKGGVQSLRAAITKERSEVGSGSPKAQAMLDAIRNAPIEDQVMWRGMRVKKSAKALLEEYAEGAQIDMNLSSFSSSAGVAQTFAGGAGSGGTEVIIGVVGKHKAIPIQNLAKTSSFFSEKELITGGRFKVIGAEKQGKQIVITLQQIGVL